MHLWVFDLGLPSAILSCWASDASVDMAVADNSQHGSYALQTKSRDGRAKFRMDLGFRIRTVLWGLLKDPSPFGLPEKLARCQRASTHSIVMNVSSKAVVGCGFFRLAPVYQQPLLLFKMAHIT